jgi:hypothetical protein
MKSRPLDQSATPAPSRRPISPVAPVRRSWIATRTTKVNTPSATSIQIASSATG